MATDPDRSKRSRWHIVGSVSGLAAALAPRYFHGALSLICEGALALTFFVATYYTFRNGPGPFHSHSSLTR